MLPRLLPGIVNVEILVHIKALRHNRRGTLMGRLADSVNVEHVEAEPIRLSCNKVEQTVHLTRNFETVELLLRRGGRSP